MPSFKKLSLLQRIIIRLVATAGVVVWFIFLYRLMLPRIGAFGCFDDCFNIVGGYFLGQGRELYSELFFNHQPLAAYLSLGIQSLTHPQTIYELIKRHREFVLFWALLWNVFFLWRFGYSFLLFSFLYEFTKPFVFGERFLAEGIVVYPLIYSFGIFWERLAEKIIFLRESLFVLICCFGVFWLREPFIPVAAVYTLLLVFFQRKTNQILYLLAVVLFMCLLPLFVIPWDDYWEQIVVVNTHVHGVAGALSVRGLVTAFIYPFFVFGKTNVFGMVQQLIIGTVFILLVFLRKHRMSSIKLLFTGLSLAMVNLRHGSMSQMYYDAFHMIVWWGMMIAVLCFLLSYVYSQIQKKVLSLLLSGFLGISTAFMLIFHPASYLNEQVDRHAEFTTNYGSDFVYGELVNILKNPTDTLFIDGANELVYWQSGLASAYMYGWYTSSMPRFAKYREARKTLFLSQPPTFYMTFCQNKTGDTELPEELAGRYTNLLFSGRPSCLFVRTDVIVSLEPAKYAAISKYGYSFE